MPAVSDSLLLALEPGLPMTPPADHPPQAIVVLGGEVIRAHDEKLGVRPGLLTLDRLRTAAALHRRTGLPILVTGGTTQPHTAPVGLVMAAEPDGRFPDAAALGRSEIRRHLGKRPLQRRHPARRGNYLGLRGDPCLAYAARDSRVSGNRPYGDRLSHLAG